MFSRMQRWRRFERFDTLLLTNLEFGTTCTWSSSQRTRVAYQPMRSTTDCGRFVSAILRGSFAEADRGGAAAGTWIFRGGVAAAPRPRRGYATRGDDREKQGFDAAASLVSRHKRPRDE